MLRVYNPNFQARFINKVSIQKQAGSSEKYIEADASFVEFDPFNQNDLEVLQKLPAFWIGQLFATNISKKAEELAKGLVSSYQHHIYLLTTQQEEFKNLNLKDILGIAHVEKHPDKELTILKYIQVEPDSRYGRKNRPFQQIGEKMLNSIKRIYSKTPISVKSIYYATDFYEKQGFEVTDTRLLNYMWKNK